jgi:(p)ppGpp synthase/HD superfamily hydrolase
MAAISRFKYSEPLNGPDERDGIARMNLTLEISDISQLSRVLIRIGQLQNVISARRSYLRCFKKRHS